MAGMRELLVVLMGLTACGGDPEPTVAYAGPAVAGPCDDGAEPVLLHGDGDGDGYGVETYTREGCAGAPGWSTQAGDCDDTDAGVRPSATELCNEVDDDCNGTVDDVGEDEGIASYTDADGDGWGFGWESIWACVDAEGVATNSGDCDDGDPEVHPAADEVCDEVDNNCDGEIDEGVGEALSASFPVRLSFDLHWSGSGVSSSSYWELAEDGRFESDSLSGTWAWSCTGAFDLQYDSGLYFWGSSADGLTFEGEMEDADDSGTWSGIIE